MADSIYDKGVIHQLFRFISRAWFDVMGERHCDLADNVVGHPKSVDRVIVISEGFHQYESVHIVIDDVSGFLES